MELGTEALKDGCFQSQYGDADMKAFGKLALTSAAAVLFSAAAMAQDSTTTTTTTQSSPPGVFVGVPGVAGVQVGPSGGCQTRTTTQTDNVTGDSRSVSRSNC
jgi:hypothetical protein